MTFREAIVEFVGELVGTVVAGALLCLAAGVVAVGWERHRVATVTGVAMFAVAAVYGVVLLWREDRRRNAVQWIAVAAGMLTLTWVYVLAMGCC